MGRILKLSAILVSIALGLCVLIIVYQQTTLNGWYYSSRCGTQRYVSQILLYDFGEPSYDEWSIGDRWKRAHGVPCPEIWLAVTDTPLQDWPELNRQVAKQADVSVISELLQEGADPNAADRHGRTALHWAYTADRSSDYRKSLIRLLIDHGATPNTTDEDALQPKEWGGVAEDQSSAS